MRFAFCTISAFCLASGAAAQSRWVLSATPVASIGPRDTAWAYAIGDVTTAKRMSDGRIVVVATGVIRFFDARGAFLSWAGGHGRIPGPYEFIQDLVVGRGDTLLTLNINGGGPDPLGREIAWLNPQGKLVREVSFATPVTGPGEWQGSYKMGSLLPNGRLLIPQWRHEPSNAPSQGATMFRPEMRFAIRDVVAKTETPLVTLGGMRQTATAAQPFTPYPQYAIGADRFFIGDNDTTFVTAYGLSGARIGTVAIEDKQVVVNTRDLDSAKKFVLARITSTAQRDTFSRQWDGVPKPIRYPYWGRIVADPGGNVWASPPIWSQVRNEWLTWPPALPNEWSVFDPTGRRIARVVLPRSFAPMDIGADYVLGVRIDAQKVQHVELYALTRQ